MVLVFLLPAGGPASRMRERRPAGANGTEPDDCCHTLSIAEPVRLSKAAPASPRQAFHQGFPPVIYARCRAITESEAFQNTIVGVILLNAALAGLMTSQTRA